MQHNLAGAVAARLGVNSSHVMLRSINPARTPARRLRALSAQVCMYSLIKFCTVQLLRELATCVNVHAPGSSLSVQSTDCGQPFAKAHLLISVAQDVCSRRVTVGRLYVIQVHDNGDFPVHAVPFSMGGAMITPTVIPLGHPQVVSFPYPAKISKPFLQSPKEVQCQYCM